uniref:KRAB domain-containing protein n=1 Tax=Sarcophilus harrisii TaxID=9305 RepID=A0A7N4PKV3_SARHA
DGHGSFQQRDGFRTEWGFLDHLQKLLYKKVMMENARNPLSLGPPVPREDVISYFEQTEASWLLDKESLRSCLLGKKNPTIATGKTRVHFQRSTLKDKKKAFMSKSNMKWIPAWREFIELKK